MSETEQICVRMFVRFGMVFMHILGKRTPIGVHGVFQAGALDFPLHFDATDRRCQPLWHGVTTGMLALQQVWWQHARSRTCGASSTPADPQRVPGISVVVNVSAQHLALAAFASVMCAEHMGSTLWVHVV